jgi:tripartite-type tricarboxylate transporter receptor subunit TctC
MTLRAFFALLTAGLICAAGPASAQTAYPNRPINLIVPFAAGSGTDSVARLTAHHLSEALNQRIVVENRAGANGSIAANYVARAAPDGYTLFMTTNTTHSANPSLMKTLNYDPVKDFTPVSRMGNLPFMLVTNPGIPARSVQELVAHARADPGKLTYASGNSTGIVSGETLKRRAGIDMLHVPYKSTPPALADVVSGQVSMMFIDLTTGMPQVKSGGVRPLAVTTRQRTALLPELPSMEEAGVADFDINSWNGIFAPAGTPTDIVDRLNAEIRKIVAKPEIKARFAEMGFDAFASTPEELGAFVQTELVKWTKMIKDAGIEPE